MSPPPNPDDVSFMTEAVAEARLGRTDGEVPIGAVAVRAGRLVARGHNRRNALRDITAHAEMMCLRDLSKRIETFELRDVTIYSTLEPCAMCLGAMIHYRVGRVVYGERDLLLGTCGSAMDLTAGRTIEVVGGVGREPCRRLLLEFFQHELGHPATRWEDIELPPS